MHSNIECFASINSDHFSIDIDAGHTDHHTRLIIIIQNFLDSILDSNQVRAKTDENKMGRKLKNERTNKEIHSHLNLFSINFNHFFQHISTYTYNRKWWLLIIYEDIWLLIIPIIDHLFVASVVDLLNINIAIFWHLKIFWEY